MRSRGLVVAIAVVLAVAAAAAGGLFTEIQIPEEALVSDAVTSIDELKGVTTTTPILANEQISKTRLSSSETPLNEVGVSAGHIGVAVELQAPQGGAGHIQ